MDSHHAMVAHWLGCFLLAGSSTLCSALVGAATSRRVSGPLRNSFVGGRDRGLSATLSMHAGNASARSCPVEKGVPEDASRDPFDRRLAARERTRNALRGEGIG